MEKTMTNETTETVNETETVLNVSGETVSWPTLKEVEKEHFFETLKRVKGSKVQAAKLLGISLPSVYIKLKKFQKQTVNTVNQENTAL